MKGERALGLGRRVAGLRTSQGDVLRPGFSIIITSYLRILQSDIHKWPLPFKSCFTWWLVKIVNLPSEESFKVSSIGTAIAERFRRQGGIFLPNKGGGQSGTTRNWWENNCLSQQQTAQVNLFVIIFPVAPQMVQVWEEKAPE